MSYSRHGNYVAEFWRHVAPVPMLSRKVSYGARCWLAIYELELKRERQLTPDLSRLQIDRF